ncbi:MAG: DNA polymerase I [bacterium]
MADNHRLFLLDASSYLFRAYYAIGHLSNSKGIPTNAVYGFVQMLTKLIKDEKPSHLAAVWDRPEPTFRKQEFEAYKAQRKEIPPDLPEQIDWIKKILEAMKIPVLEKAGFEADDLIGTLARQMAEKGFEVIIVTGDKDMMQLVTGHITLLDTMKDRRTNIEGVKERFGVLPEKVIDVLGLAGDASDNIPGVPGIGEKTAISLIQQFGSMEGVYERLSELKGKRREILEQNKELAFLSRRLVTIDTQVPFEYRFEDFNLSEPDHGRLYEIFKELEFTRLLSQLEAPKSDVTRHYILVADEEALKDLVQNLREASEFSFDTETTSLNPLDAKLVGLSFSTEEGKAYYVPVGHVSEAPQLPLEKVLTALKPVLEDPSKGKIAQNFKYDYEVLRQAGIHVRGLHCDTMIAAYLLEPSGNHNMDALSQQYLGHKTITYEEVTGGKKGVSFSEVPIEKALEYSGEDADVTFRLYRVLTPKLKEENLEGVLREIELPLVFVLADMERAGIKIDRSFLTGLQTEFLGRIQTSEKRIYETAGETFNINSTKQLGQILFEKLKLPVQRKTKTGYSTDVDVLTELAKIHDLPKEILSYRSLAKLKSTYVDALLALADPATDRIHTSFNQTIAETGRLSSSDPNLQNIPIRTEDGKKIRQAFVADKDFKLLSADYSQIELRVLAHLSEDPTLLDAFKNEEDVHRITAASIFGLPPVEISPSMRSVGKTVNFAVIYGQTPFGLSGQLGIPPQKAKEYIDQYFIKYGKVQAYREKVLAEAREKQVVHTLYGRHRRVQDLLSKNPNIRSFAERIAFNTVIQGTAADLIKLAMIQIHRKMKERNLKSRMLLQVHDELVFEVFEPELEEVRELVRQEMEGVGSFKVPLKVEMGVGPHWGEAH